MMQQRTYNGSGIFSNSSTKIGNIFIATTFTLAIVGFYSLAPIITILSSDDVGTISIGLRALILGAALILLFFAKTPRNIGAGQYLAPLFIMLLAFALRAYHNIYMEKLSVYIPSELLYGFLFGAGIIPALMAARLGPRVQDHYFVYAMVICSLLFLIGLSLNLDALIQSNEVQARMSIKRLNPIGMTSMAFNFCLFYAIFFRHSKVVKYLALIIIPLCLVIAAFSKSRGPIVGIVFTLIVYFLTTHSKHKKSMVQAGLVILFMTITLNSTFEINLFSTMIERFFETGETNNYLSVTIRQEQWTAAWQGFLDNPFLGRYIFEQAYYYYPHNVLLECLMALGCCGGLLYLSHIFISFRACFFIIKSSLTNKTALFSALLFLKSFGQSMFSGSIWGSSVLWISSAYIISYAHFLKKQENTYSRNALATSSPIRRRRLASDVI